MSYPRLLAVKAIAKLARSGGLLSSCFAACLQMSTDGDEEAANQKQAMRKRFYGMNFDTSSKVLNFACDFRRFCSRPPAPVPDIGSEEKIYHVTLPS